MRKRWFTASLFILSTGLGFPLLNAWTQAWAQTPGNSLSQEAQCQIQFGEQLRAGRCRVTVSQNKLTATLMAPRAQPSDNVAGELLRNRRAANQSPQDVAIEIAADTVFSVNYQRWNEVSGGFLTFSVVNIDYAVVEVGFITEPTPEQPNRSNILKIATDTEFGTALKDALDRDRSSSTALLTSAGITSQAIGEGTNSTTDSVIDTETAGGDVSEQVQQLLETNACVRCDLRGANLAKADLDNANLEGANLQGANLNKAELNRAYLVGANLSEANLIEADLDKAKLLYASLSQANLTKAKLLEANLTNANLQNAILTEARLSAPTLMPGVNLAGADLSSARLAGVDLAGADLTGANLENADLSDTTLEVQRGVTDAGEVAVSLVLGTDSVKNFKFATNLTGANLTGANLSQANLEEAVLTNANLSNANLSNAEIEDVDLAATNLCGATMPDGTRSEQGC